MQRRFVEKLLENSVFNKHLTAVREINNMLQRAKDVRTASSEANAGKPMKVCVPFCLPWHRCKPEEQSESKLRQDCRPLVSGH